MFSDGGRTLRFLRSQAPAVNAFPEDVRFEGDLWDAVLRWSHESGIRSILVEGGRETLASLIDRNLWDEARILTAPLWLGSGLRAPEIQGVLMQKFSIGSDELQILSPKAL
jgi:riboflavin biosynthesis pyrimidine reductase